jgi:hypothetical protein
MLARQVVLLTPQNSSHPQSLLSRQHNVRISPLFATLIDLPASAANKRLTSNLNPLDATLTKNTGALDFFDSLTFRSFNSLTIFRPVFSIAYALFQVTYPVSPLLATLMKTAGCIPTIPILELSLLRSTLNVASTLRPSDVPTVPSPVPNRTDDSTPLHVHPLCAMLRFPRWRSS